MLITEDGEREQLARFARATDGTLTFKLRGEQTAFRVGEPVQVEQWQVSKLLERRGLLASHGLNEVTGSQTFWLTARGWHAVESPSAPLPAVEGDAVAATAQLGYRAVMEANAP
jgi:hypothetical protein